MKFLISNCIPLYVRTKVYHLTISKVQQRPLSSTVEGVAPLQEDTQFSVIIVALGGVCKKFSEVTVPVFSIVYNGVDCAQAQVMGRELVAADRMGSRRFKRGARLFFYLFLVAILV